MQFLVSIVDEAHALINPEHIEGRGQFGFATAFGPQAYHIIRSSVITVFLLDPQQGFRERENTTVGDMRKMVRKVSRRRLSGIKPGGQSVPLRRVERIY